MRVLFVCTGNTCRSPIAEGLAKLYFSNKIDVSSAGIAACDGEVVNKHAVKVMFAKGVDIKNHRAKKISNKILVDIDYIVTMTKSQEVFLEDEYPNLEGKIICLGDWCGMGKDVSDPWGGSEEVYRQCAVEIEKMIKIIATKISEQQ
ncbi:MAG: low molecular weight protein arginine phosphatase [Eubacteriales bacterium]